MDMDRDEYVKLMAMPSDAKLTVNQLACAMYEGTRHVQNLAEKTARTHGKAESLSCFALMGDDVQNFWRGIAKQIIDHSACWDHNDVIACVLSEPEVKRLRELPMKMETGTLKAGDSGSISISLVPELTMLDYFAAMAMQALTSREDIDGPDTSSGMSALAISSYRMAQALLSERRRLMEGENER